MIGYAKADSTVVHTDASQAEPSASSEVDAPRAIDWIWRPWYARLWWGAIALFWAVATLYPLLEIRRFPVSSTALMYVAMILHPQAALPVLGFGYLRALFKYQTELRNTTEEDEAGVEDHDPFSHGLFGHDLMSYLSDPSDPRSPLSPLNPAHPHYIYGPDR